MTRSLSANASNALAAEVVAWGALLELRFDSGTVYVWNGQGPLSYGGNTYLGTGQMGSVSGVAEDTQLSDTDIEVTLSHITKADMPDLVNELLDSEPVGRTFVLSLALFDANNSIIDVITLSSGWIDAVDYKDDESGGSVTVKLASEARLMDRTLFYRLDCEHQKYLFPGDTGLCKRPKTSNIALGGKVASSPYTSAPNIKMY